ncbi:MAG: ferrous iron transport protein B [Lentisphaeria bacterium]|nr:ferrous iron transport protein B [Lentisphaeria bacterium]
MSSEQLQAPPASPMTFLVAVAGNPNAGKTTLFNMLTGANHTVGNYPGVTVERREGMVASGPCRLRMVDLPGTYSLTAYSMEEVVARTVIVEEHPDIVLDVVDASNLERNLYLAMQLAEMERPMVLALNMHDIAVQRGIRIDMAKLSAYLGVPVVATVGHRRSGRTELLETLVRTGRGEIPQEPLRVKYGAVIEEAIEAVARTVAADAALSRVYSVRWLAVKLLEEDARAVERVRAEADGPTPVLDAAQRQVARILAREGEDPATLIAEHRYGHAAGVMRDCVRVSDRGTTVTDAIDTIVCNRFLGLAVVALVVFLTFKATFVLADGWRFIPWKGGWTTPVGVSAWFFEELLPGLTVRMGPGPLRSLIDDGVIAGVGGVMGFVPLIFFMFLFLALIEDSGYIARIAFVLDRVLRVFGLQGKSILALIVSGGIAGGCAVPGVLATRILREEKDRLTTMLVVPFMNCGAKMPVFAMLIAAFFSRWQGEMLWLLAALSWCFALLAALLLRKTVVRGGQTPFVMELPPYHIPVLRNILRSALERSWMYIRKAGTVILGVSILLWAFMYFPRSDARVFEARRTAAETALRTHLETTRFAHLTAGAGLRDTVQAARDAVEDRTEAARPDQAQARSLPELLARCARGLDRPDDPELQRAAEALARYLEAIDAIGADEARERLLHSFAGRLGRFLEPLASWAGFDWRDSIALIGGVAAKEVIVSTLGMAYHMGHAGQTAEGTGYQSLPLVRALRADPDWNALRALALILFVMLYAPCLVTVITIARESGSWRWAAFSTCYSTALAFAVAVLVYRVGLLFGLGT